MKTLYDLAIKHLTLLKNDEVDLLPVNNIEASPEKKRYVPGTKPLYNLRYIYDKNTNLPILDANHLSIKLSLREDLLSANFKFKLATRV